MSVRITGNGQIAVRLKALEQGGGDIGAIALVRTAERTMTDAKKLTPVDTGALRASGHVKPPDQSGDTVSVELGFATPYAVIVHERTDVHHPVGQAKYLEAALQQHAPEAAAELRRGLDEFTAQWRVGASWAAEIARATVTPPEASGAA